MFMHMKWLIYIFGCKRHAHILAMTRFPLLQLLMAMLRMHILFGDCRVSLSCDWVACTLLVHIICL